MNIWSPYAYTANDILYMNNISGYFLNKYTFCCKYILVQSQKRNRRKRSKKFNLNLGHNNF